MPASPSITSAAGPGRARASKSDTARTSARGTVVDTGLILALQHGPAAPKNEKSHLLAGGFLVVPAGIEPATFRV